MTKPKIIWLGLVVTVSLSVLTYSVTVSHTRQNALIRAARAESETQFAQTNGWGSKARKLPLIGRLVSSPPSCSFPDEIPVWRLVMASLMKGAILATTVSVLLSLLKTYFAWPHYGLKPDDMKHKSDQKVSIKKKHKKKRPKSLEEKAIEEQALEEKARLKEEKARLDEEKALEEKARLDEEKARLDEEKALEEKARLDEEKALEEKARLDEEKALEEKARLDEEKALEEKARLDEEKALEEKARLDEEKALEEKALLDEEKALEEKALEAFFADVAARAQEIIEL
nr:stress response protein NST1-like [Procambarus clarkii]